MGFFDRLKKGLNKTRENLTNKIEKIIVGYADIDEDLLDELEETLIMADVGVKTTDKLMTAVRKGIKKKEINTPEDLKPFLQNEIVKILTAGEDTTRIAENGPTVLLVIGVNGAGKTTTIRMMTMQARPTSGIILYDGLDTRRDARRIKSLIGVVPQHVNFDQDLTVGENLELHARLHHMGKEERRARIEELLRYVELADVINDGVRRLSGGMKRRLLIVRALLHRPRILFLDEPTVALDPQVRRRIWALVKDMAKGGVTVFLTTHYIEEAEALCDRVAILSKGHLIDLDTPANLRQKTNLPNLEEVFLALTAEDGAAGKGGRV